jgi:uncharacterized protein (TIGR02598 family)
VKRTAAFTLVEVVVTLGVIAFALVAIIGLFPIGLKSGRLSIEETRANALSAEVFNSIRAQPFAAITFGALGNGSAPSIDLSTADTSGSSTKTQLYANYNGTFVSSSDFFSILITYRNTPTGLSPGAANEVHIAITPREGGAQPFQYATIIAAQ